MDTNRIKRFATEARNILKAGIAAKIMTLGFDKKGKVAEEHRPQLMQGGTLWNGQFYTEGFYHQWMSLYNRIQQKGINEVYEEAAYTWFNRLCAIRILQKNNLCSPVLQYSDAARTPIIVDEARQGHLPQMKEDLRQRIVELLDDDTKVTEQFALLITAWCHDNPILNKCFGSMADYTELLLPNNILTEGGFVDMLNHTEFITDEDFQSPELIGWLYQFYISERKDEVFAKKGKFEADEIPAATQIFTPNWIVKYMVQNTVGRIYLDNNPYETTLQKKWQYLVEPAEKRTPENILKYNELIDLKVADLACGSGHILNECFDLLYDLYIAEGYGRDEAIENIFRHNLTGVDLDNRAKQLATFALLLKACQKDSSFADAHCLPNVLTMPRPWNEEVHGNFSDFLSLYFQGENTISQSDELSVCFELMRDADSLGSIMKFDINDSTRLLVKQTTNFWCSQEFVPDNIRLQIPTFKLILALTEKYDALVMNPPYMGGGNMNEVLGSYCANYYQEGKADLMTVFMQKSMNATTDKGYWAMINLPSWMFLPSFEQIRDQLINTQCICSLNYNGRGIFGSDFGSVSFIIKNVKKPIIGIYRKLFTIQGSVRSNDEIKTNYEDRNFGRYLINQNEFLKVPGKALAFWLPMTILDSFNHKISDFAIAKKGLSTGNNNLFLRLWFEVSKNKSIYETDNFDNDKTWYPINKGGGYRKWYGNNEYVINWKNNGADIKHFAGSVIRNPQYYLKESLTWTMLSASCFGVRYSKAGKLFEGAGPSLFADKNQLYFILSFLCSKLGNLIIRALNPTINININDVLNLPLKQVSSEIIENISVNNICISKNDWDSHETSWDFEVNPVLAVNENTYIDNINHEIEQHEKETGEHICIDPAAPELGSLQWRIEQYKKKWTHLFMQLYANEVELNRQFIEIYELQDGLTPDVPLSEITILQHGEINVADESLSWNDEVLMKQLISYAVGCMLGRYRLDRPGLHIAHPDPTDEETASYMYNEQTWEIDDDGIMPLMTNDC